MFLCIGDGLRVEDRNETVNEMGRVVYKSDVGTGGRGGKRTQSLASLKVGPCVSADLSCNHEALTPLATTTLAGHRSEFIKFVELSQHLDVDGKLRDVLETRPRCTSTIVINQSERLVVLRRRGQIDQACHHGRPRQRAAVRRTREASASGWIGGCICM